MRRFAFGLLLAALSLCVAPSFAADAPAAASSAAPTPVTATGPAAAPAVSTQAMPSAATATAAPTASTAPAPAAAPAQPETAATPSPTPSETPAPAPAAQATPASQSQAGGIDAPIRGMNMANVEHIFGTPIQKYDAVGKPPITRWDYPDYVVYFEYNMVLHTVMK